MNRIYLEFNVKDQNTDGRGVVKSLLTVSCCCKFPTAGLFIFSRCGYRDLGEVNFAESLVSNNLKEVSYKCLAVFSFIVKDKYTKMKNLQTFVKTCFLTVSREFCFN